MADASTILELENNLIALQEELNSYKYIASEEVTIEDLRDIYAQKLAAEGQVARAKEIINQSVKQPIFRKYIFNGEDEPDQDTLKSIPMDAAIDIASLDNKIITLTGKYATLLSNTISRLNAAKTRVFENRQRIQDINFINSTYNNLTNIVNMDKDDFTGTFSTIGNTKTFCAYSDTADPEVEITVTNVSGNGYVGNHYVINNSGDFISETLDTSDLNNLTDDSVLTAFEYSRLVAPSSETSGNINVNHDNKNVTCTITIAGEDNFNTLVFNTKSSEIVVKDVLVSDDDGKSYHSTFSKERALTTSEYTNHDYVANSGVVSFPMTKYAKVILSSTYAFLGEKLAEERNTLDADKKPITVIQSLNDVTRRVISINSITAINAVRTNNSVLQSYQMIPSGVTYNHVAIFANEYIPENFSRDIDYVTYNLYVNGQMYNVVPINSDEEGIKLLSCADYHYDNTTTLFLDEPIKTCQLIINIHTNDSYSTPFVGNVKMCFG